MRLNPEAFAYLTANERRVLNSVEIGHKNHELVPLQIIESIASLKRGGTFKLLRNLLRLKLVAHDRSCSYDGYKLTYNGYDCLALRALSQQGLVEGVGPRIGVGKESDIHISSGAEDRELIVKFHRLGRVSFKTVKNNRDYLQHRRHASWMYLARLAAMKEFAYLKALHSAGFPVPEPIAQNRHAVVMQFMQVECSIQLG